MFLSAKRYSVSSSLVHGLEANGIETLSIDYEEYFPEYINAFVRKYESLPNRVKETWKRGYVKKINNFYKATFAEFKPDIVLIYNNQNVQPWLLEEFKKTSEIAFILGDHPLYTPTNIYSLQILFYADYIISPDSFWCSQLAAMGVPHIVFDSFASDPGTYFPIDPEFNDLKTYGSEVAYIGTSHKNSWGYKRFLFLSQFRKFNLKAFMSGDGYTGRWKEFFPELGNSIIRHDRFDPQFNNMVYNCSKVCPVDLVPSLFNGVHVRIWDILGSGSFPLCEYSSDLDEVFKGIQVPFIRKYNEAADITGYLLKNESERSEMIREMKSRAMTRFSPEKVISRMLSYMTRMR